MSKGLASKIFEGLVALTALLGGLYLDAWAYAHASRHGDPDQWYHYAISRQMVAQRRLINALPQVEDLNWKFGFPDKEFLFHVWTAVGYWLKGDQGVRLSCHALALGFCFFLYLMVRRQTSALTALLLIFFFGLLDYYFSARLSLIRPHLLAIVSILFLIQGLLSRKKWWAFLGSALFGLGYHAFYVPALVVAGSALRPEKPKANFKTELFALLGLAAGIVVNPYFPGSFALGIVCIKIALAGAPESGLSPGAELYSLPLKDFALWFGPLILAYFWAIFYWVREKNRAASEAMPRDFEFLLLAAAAFWILTTKSPRACEYAVPLSILAVAYAIRLGAFEGARRKIFLGSAMAAGMLGMAYTVATSRASEAQESYRAAFSSAVLALPAEAAGKKVFTCDWRFGSFLLYRRPDVRFVDILDPYLLKDAAPEKFRLLLSLKRGNVPDAHTLLKTVFDADYVLCDDPDLNRQLARDVHFTNRFEFQSPGNGGLSLALFEVAKERNPAFVTKFRVMNAAMKREVASAADLANPFAEISQGPNVKEGNVSAYIDFRLMPPALSSRGGANGCYLVAPARSEQERLAGSSYLGIGGGPQIRAWLNQRPLFLTQTDVGEAQLVNSIVPLPKPLTPKDELLFEVCRGTNFPFWGFSLSLWKDEALNAVCKSQMASSSARSNGYCVGMRE